MVTGTFVAQTWNVVGSDQGRIMYTWKTNCSEVHLEPKGLGAIVLHLSPITAFTSAQMIALREKTNQSLNELNTAGLKTPLGLHINYAQKIILHPNKQEAVILNKMQLR